MCPEHMRMVAGVRGGRHASLFPTHIAACLQATQWPALTGNPFNLESPYKGGTAEYDNTCSYLLVLSYSTVSPSYGDSKLNGLRVSADHWDPLLISGESLHSHCTGHPFILDFSLKLSLSPTKVLWRSRKKLNSQCLMIETILEVGCLYIYALYPTLGQWAP